MPQVREENAQENAGTNRRAGVRLQRRDVGHDSIGLRHHPRSQRRRWLDARRLEALRAEMGLRIGVDKIPEIVFLAVDPARDRPVLKDYLANFDPSNVGITGAKPEIDKLVKGLEAAYRFSDKKPGSDYYDVLHSSAISLINPQGELTAQLNPPFAVQPMTQFLVTLIRQAESSVHAGAEIRALANVNE